jgi:chitosanase
VDELTVKKIKNVLNIAEQGTQTIPYGKVEVMPDGPNGVRQVTLSVGFTQYGSNLGKVLKEYAKRGGRYHGLADYAMDDASLADNRDFKNLLKAAGSDPIMQEVQEDLYTSLYIGPALAWAETEGFTEPLSLLVIADSFLHSGSMLGFLRQRFVEKTPKAGGQERVWIASYTEVRHNWLANHSTKLLRNTVYRTKYYRQLIDLGDWPLEVHHNYAMNGIKPTQYVA